MWWEFQLCSSRRRKPLKSFDEVSSFEKLTSLWLLWARPGTPGSQLRVILVLPVSPCLRDELAQSF